MCRNKWLEFGHSSSSYEQAANWAMLWECKAHSWPAGNREQLEDPLSTFSNTEIPGTKFHFVHHYELLGGWVWGACLSRFQWHASLRGSNQEAAFFLVGGLGCGHRFQLGWAKESKHLHSIVPIQSFILQYHIKLPGKKAHRVCRISPHKVRGEPGGPEERGLSITPCWVRSRPITLGTNRKQLAWVSNLYRSTWSQNTSTCWIHAQ
jgi:hypothetical protein